MRAHDVHHHKFNWNYGQYIMFWDRVFGTFRSYEDTPLPRGTDPVAIFRAKRAERVRRKDK